MKPADHDKAQSLQNTAIFTGSDIYPFLVRIPNPSKMHCKSIIIILLILYYYIIYTNNNKKNFCIMFNCFLS